MAGKKPHYNFADFLADCKQGSAKAFVTGGAMKTATDDFRLGTQDKVLSFVSGNGLEKPSFIRSDVWANNPNPKAPIQVDSYSFFSGLDYGYLAFLFQPATDKWIIKSFKKNQQSDPRHLPFAELKALINEKGPAHDK